MTPTQHSSHSLIKAILIVYYPIVALSFRSYLNSYVQCIGYNSCGTPEAIAVMTMDSLAALLPVALLAGWFEKQKWNQDQSKLGSEHRRDFLILNAIGRILLILIFSFQIFLLPLLVRIAQQSLIHRQ